MLRDDELTILTDTLDNEMALGKILPLTHYDVFAWPQVLRWNPDFDNDIVIWMDEPLYAEQCYDVLAIPNILYVDSNRPIVNFAHDRMQFDELLEYMCDHLVYAYDKFSDINSR